MTNSCWRAFLTSLQLCLLLHQNCFHSITCAALSSCSSAEHNRFKQTSEYEAEREKKHDLRRRALKQRELRNSFRKRRLQNFFRESNLTGTVRVQPVPPSTHFERLEQCNEPKKKSRVFYKKTRGFIWSDLGHTPRNRLGLVVRPISAKRDRECLERLVWKVEQEEEHARTLARLRLDRIAAQRERRLEKVSTERFRSIPTTCDKIHGSRVEPCSILYSINRSVPVRLIYVVRILGMYLQA